MSVAIAKSQRLGWYGHIAAFKRVMTFYRHNGKYRLAVYV